MEGGWRTHPNENGITHEVLDHAGVSVAVVFAWDGGDARTRAQLISAAPELMAATEAMLKNLDCWLETGIPAGPAESKRLYDMMLDAATKARGGGNE